MSCRARSHYRPGLGWILGVAFGDTLTRPVRLAQEFTFVRCCSSPRASSPHGLAAPGRSVFRRHSLRAVASSSRLLPTRPAKDFHLHSSAHARHTSPVALRAPSATASEEEPNDPFIEDFSNEVMCMSYLYSKLPETGVSPHIGTGGTEGIFGQRNTVTLPCIRNRRVTASPIPSSCIIKQH